MPRDLAPSALRPVPRRGLRREEAAMYVGVSPSKFGSLVDDPSKADLLTTLCSFFDNMGSIRGSAAALDVHENTIRYRLSRIEEITGLAVTHDPDSQLRARLSLLVLLLQGRLPARDAGDAPDTPRKLEVVRATAV